ncbi:MAG: thioredoxin-disulfide reductase [Anaerolineales bacterium]
MAFNLSGVNYSSTSNSADEEKVKVLIIGSGPAGLAAALYTARADLNPVVLAGMELGGQVSLTYLVENYPGFPEGVGGTELVELFQKQAEKFGARVEFDTATEVDLKQRPFKVVTYNKVYYAESLIIATGATSLKLNIPGEKELTGKGVSYCATCDGWFFKDKDVIVVGGGDSALEEGIFLTRYAKSVKIVHRRDTLRAGNILQKRAKENPKISFIFNTVLTEIIGEEAVKEVKMKNLVSGEEWKQPIDGVFIFIGHAPNTQLFEGQLELDPGKYIITDRLMQTNVEGVFAAGEAADPTYRQVITSAGMGAAAAMRAIHFLGEHSSQGK